MVDMPGGGATPIYRYLCERAVPEARAQGQGEGSRRLFGDSAQGSLTWRRDLDEARLNVGYGKLENGSPIAEILKGMS